MLERLFTSRSRIELLELFLLHPEREIHVREICRITGLNINSVRRELANLEQLGLLRSRTGGNARFYTVNIGFPIYQELVGILLKMG
ncbi:MAG TPA: winged helix-turn-helix domain-containing protein [Methanomicrobiales archaeon]|jgi:DNA-binding MarR family transcriptional regulator|nr:winged helix-turn-helix domain-containing protein [Methanomicrobiales archaeon]